MIEAGTVLAVDRITITEVYDGEQGELGVDANLLEWVEEWNSNLTMIDSNMVVTPKIFAGVKNSSNTITGVALGNFSMLARQDNGEFVVENVNGLYGFWEGLKTFSIDSSGDVTFGRNDHCIKYTASTGLIEFGAGVAMAWVGATYIDKDGIFTGSLSADSVNAISLSAVQITTGTLSADRIAAGSITATHLDATSVKSSIINTDYINGLSCTFTKGTIGGWSIASGNISCGQIMLNSTSNRIAVYGSTSSSTSGHRVQFYYTSDSSFGFYATNSSGTCIAQLGSANQIAGWQITSSAIYKNSVYFGSDGSIYNGTKWKLNYDGSGQLANGNISWDTAGSITAKNAIFTNVRVQGSVRNPFVLNDSTIWVGGDSSDQTNFNNYDNIVAVNTSSWASYIPLPWTLENSGRRITLVNYKWSTTTSTGYMSISAPTGQYFYEDGIAKSSISFSRECIELLGYGDSSTFLGWIVLNRINLMTTSCYGKNLRVLAFGKVTGTASTATITYTTFDNTTMSVSRMSQGKYRVAFSSTWGLSSSNALIMLTGYGYAVESSTAPIKATLYAIYTTSFYVNTSDDNSGNDGSFYFQITNMNDWTY